MKRIVNAVKQVALVAALLSPIASWAAPLASILPSQTSIAAGRKLTLAIDLTDIADLYAYNFTLLYNPTTVRFDTLSEATFLGTAGPTFFIPGIDNLFGSVAFSGASLIGAIPGASGSGNLVNFSFTPVANGLAQFSLADVLFLDSGITEILIGVKNALVTVGDGGTVVPEPSTIMLLAAGLLILVGFGETGRSRKAAFRG